MGAAALATVGITAAGGIMSANAQGAAGRMQASYYSYLANNANLNAGLAKAYGESQAKTIGAANMRSDVLLGEKERATVGAQKAALAAGGAGASSKTAEQLIADTANKGNLDEQALNLNAALKTKAAITGADMAAFNDVTQAQGYDQAGLNAGAAGKMNRASTILGTGGQVANIWYRSPWGV